MTNELIWLLLAAFGAGMMDAAIGGGGLISIPALFSVLPAESPAALMGTNKWSASQGTLLACWRYGRRIPLNWSLLLPVAALAFAGSYLGARSLDLLPVDWIRPMVILLLTLMWIYIALRPGFGLQDRQRPLVRRDGYLGVMIGALIGFYDGFFGPGTGSFLIFLFIRVLHFDFLRASASAKVVNLATNLAALVFFIPQGVVLWQYALPMGICSLLGAWVGSRLALRGGNRWLRPVFLSMVALLLVRLLLEQWG